MASLSLSGAKAARTKAGEPTGFARLLPADADSAEGIISVADRRMYRDKAQRKRLGTGALPPADCLWH